MASSLDDLYASRDEGVSARLDQHSCNLEAPHRTFEDHDRVTVARSYWPIVAAIAENLAVNSPHIDNGLTDKRVLGLKHDYISTGPERNISDRGEK